MEGGWGTGRKGTWGRFTDFRFRKNTGVLSLLFPKLLKLLLCPPLILVDKSAISPHLSSVLSPLFISGDTSEQTIPTCTRTIPELGLTSSQR
jgi:hypothetical protein